MNHFTRGKTAGAEMNDEETIIYSTATFIKSYFIPQLMFYFHIIFKTLVLDLSRID